MEPSVRMPALCPEKGLKGAPWLLPKAVRQRTVNLQETQRAGREEGDSAWKLFVLPALHRMLPGSGCLVTA